MAWRTKRQQPVEIEVRAPLGALDDVVDLGDPSAAAVSTPFTWPLWLLFPKNEAPLSPRRPWLCFAESLEQLVFKECR